MSTQEEVPKAEGTNQDQNDEWIVQSKPRRLVPQHSLSRQDLEADKSKVPVASAADTKKKGNMHCCANSAVCVMLLIMFCMKTHTVVIRFTKEEMMTFRQPAKLLSHMAEMVEVISTDRLNPVCFERFEPEDVSIHLLVVQDVWCAYVVVMLGGVTFCFALNARGHAYPCAKRCYEHR